MRHKLIHLLGSNRAWVEIASEQEYILFMEYVNDVLKRYVRAHPYTKGYTLKFLSGIKSLTDTDCFEEANYVCYMSPKKPVTYPVRVPTIAVIQRDIVQDKRLKHGLKHYVLILEPNFLYSQKDQHKSFAEISLNDITRYFFYFKFKSFKQTNLVFDDVTLISFPYIMYIVNLAFGQWLYNDKNKWKDLVAILYKKCL